MANQSAPSSNRAPAKLRCAIYTRKSSEEGLEQDFNSLDAQREACEAFITSQKREGWVLVSDMYDDGGFSGGTIERPAFQRLLSDVSADKIDIVVVYKVDRLTRSLSDFAKIVDIFDKHTVSFVSVTQQFNTTSSMGRLTLNILLSFAQFEREVTGERIRDKIAASKKKGMWMGGLPSLGYDVKDRKLIVNKTEAETVRHIFRRYIELKSVRELKEDLDGAGIVSKIRTASDGSRYGGQPLARGAIYLILQNRIYRGEIVHKDKSYPGEHEAIVDEVLWNNVQAILSENRVDRANGKAGNEPNLLMGILFDAHGDRMSPTHANKKGTRYRYYISRSLLDGSTKAQGAGQRIPAIALESLVVRRVRDWLAEPAAILRVVQHAASDAVTQKRLIERAGHFAAGDHDRGSEGLRPFLRSSIGRVQVHADRIDITLDQDRVCRWLDGTVEQIEPIDKHQSGADHQVPTLSIPARLKRTGKEMRIIVADGSEPGTPDSGLIRLLVRANAIQEQLLADRSLTFEDIAKSEGVVPSYATRLFRLTVLAPDIVSAILSGKHPPELTARRLMDDTRLPLDWNEQRRRLGFESAC
ncbi:MAG: recombinase family protein [Nitrospirota bacterium]|nr:recombinase family protein [Nitrospirota bacterium]